MTVINIVGFETGDTFDFGHGGAGTKSVQSSVKRTGSYALRCNPTTTNVGWMGVSAHNLSQLPMNINGGLYYRFYFRVDTLPSSNSEEFAAAAGVTTGILHLRITSAGNIQAYAADGTTQLGSDGATTLATDGTWYRIEMYCEEANPGAYTVKIDGATELSGTGNLNGGNHNYLVLGKWNNRNGQSVDFYYDDAAIDTAAYPGAGEIKRLAVTRDGTYTSWTIWSGSGADYETVDEIPPNTSDGLGSTLVVGESSTVGFATTASAGISGTVYAVKHGGIYQRQSAGASMKIRLRSGGSDYDSSAFATGATATYVAQVYSTDPSTSAAWTLGAIDAVESGGVENTNVVGDASVMWCILLTVDYNPATPRSFGTIIG